MVEKIVLWSLTALLGGPSSARDQRGASAVEYGLFLALIAAVIIVTVTTMGIKVGNAYDSVVTLWP
ncbi:pilus assembly protein Flp/PilA [Nocardioides ginsengisegetis]|uniref:Pilus assembly protein Flp/PilA n=1 Tax=Nocardioides ginsengisegetis TaxID=661491 RepID=A0A7W3IYU7_9ACTN|nr:Flp family type IVb pilin [Nocardioides ginsengisegetis]MBA8803181.1 pilus assembly protein Flp/PilA [Nocardioides ginsengisegetis]